ncbi:hypothetical protein CHUAL_007990 [Chamberlinius hualienensis]
MLYGAPDEYVDVIRIRNDGWRNGYDYSATNNVSSAAVAVILTTLDNSSINSTSSIDGSSMVLMDNDNWNEMDLTLTFDNVSDGELFDNVTQISEDNGNLFLFVTYGVLVTFIGLMGLAGNILSIIVLSRPQMRSSINCCLIGLATFDILVLVTSTLMFGIPRLTGYTGFFVAYNQIIFPNIIPYFVYPVGLIAQTGSVWVTVTVTIERYVAVCIPLRAKSLCTYGRARVYILIIAMFSICYNLPRFWEVERCSEVDPVTNITEYYAKPSYVRANQTYVKVYITWMYLFVLYFVPFVTLAVLNSIIWLRVRAANRERQKLSRLQQKEMGLAIMLFCVVVVFFICNLLPLLVNVLEVLDIIIDELTASSNLLVTMNSSVNFVIYCIFGQKFRRILLRTVCSCLPTQFRHGRLSRGNDMEESTYPVSSSYYTAETTLLVHYNNGHGHTANTGYHFPRNSGVSIGAIDKVSRSPSIGVPFKIDSSRSTPSPIQRSNSHLGYLNVEFRPSTSSSSSLSGNNCMAMTKSMKSIRRHSSKLSIKWNSSNSALHSTN